MEGQATKKTNFFKEVGKSIKDLDKYEDFAIEAPKKAFMYFIKLLLVFCLIIACFYTYKIVDNMNHIYHKLKENLPEFSYTQGKLMMSSEEPIVIDDYQESIGKIIIDTSNEDNTEKYQIKNQGVLFLKDKVLLLSNNAMGQVSYSYQELAQTYNIPDFTKQEAIHYIDGMNQIPLYLITFVIIFVYLFLIYFISIFLDVLLLSILALLVSRIARIQLKYAPCFAIAAHAITLPVLLNLIYINVNLLTGFQIKYFQLMYSTISYIYIIVAILMIKTDFIDRQKELMKLAQEQEKIKEELKKQEEEEKQKQQEEQKKQEEKEETNKKPKRKKENKEEKGVGADAPACEETGK